MPRAPPTIASTVPSRNSQKAGCDGADHQAGRHGDQRPAEHVRVAEAGGQSRAGEADGGEAEHRHRGDQAGQPAGDAQAVLDLLQHRADAGDRRPQVQAGQDDRDADQQQPPPVVCGCGRCGLRGGAGHPGMVLHAGPSSATGPGGQRRATARGTTPGMRRQTARWTASVTVAATRIPARLMPSWVAALTELRPAAEGQRDRHVRGRRHGGDRDEDADQRAALRRRQRQHAGDPGEHGHDERPLVGCGDEAGLRAVGAQQFGAEPAEAAADEGDGRRQPDRDDEAERPG